METRDTAPAWLELAAIGLIAGALIIDLAGAVSGLLLGGGWAWTPLEHMPEVLVQLAADPGSPRDAFPPVIRADLPGPVAFYLVIGVLSCAPLWALARLARRSTRTGGPEAARWARAPDLRPLRVIGSQPARLTLGHAGRRLLAAEARQSVIVIAPTQSGKTTGLAIPAILEWQGPVLATSVKNDLVRDTLAARRQVGRVQVFDPAATTGIADTASWTPLAGCSDWRGARRTAAWLAEGAAPARRGLSDSDFWYASATKLLAPLLFAAASSGRTMGDVVTWLDTREEQAVAAALERAKCTAATDAMNATWRRDERQQSSIYTTAETILEAYADPGVLEHSRTAEIRAEQLLDGGWNTLYLCATIREQRRLRPVFVALLQELIEAGYRRAASRGGPADPPLLLVLDEAANIAPLPDLDVVAATGAGQGIQLLTILQDLAQAQDRWGRDRADTIVNNHRAKIIGAGVSDARTLEAVGRLLGDTELRQESWTAGDGRRRSTTTSTTFRALAPPNALRENQPGSAVLVYGTLPPARIRLRAWFSDPRLRKLVRVR